MDGTWKGPVICGVVWAAALLGVTLNAVSVERFEKFSMLLYIAMGWAVVFAVGDVVRALPSAGFWLLLLGGVSYTGGIVFYAWHKKGVCITCTAYGTCSCCWAVFCIICVFCCMCCPGRMPDTQPLQSRA